MAKKPFEDTPYNPIKADLMRDVAAPVRSISGSAALQLTPQVSEPDFRRPSAPLPPRPKTTAHLSPVMREIGITKRFELKIAENSDLNAFLLRLQQRTGVKVHLSVFVRALVMAALQAESSILEEAAQFAFRLPSTHDSFKQGEFEDLWRECLAEALRRAPRST
jgi:hypothetical protein